MLLLLVVCGAMVVPSAKPLIDKHANPEPGEPQPSQV